jgi:outer membrane cobalamin receptor
MKIILKYQHFVFNINFFKNILVIFLIILTNKGIASDIVFKGIVKDANTLEPLIGVNIYNKAQNRGVYSDIKGHFSIALDHPDTIIFSYVGYFASTIFIDNSTEKEVLLLNEELNTVVITADSKYTQPQLSGLNTTYLDKKALEQLPKVLGEYEVIKSIQTLPGVQSGGEGERGIFVRGGGTDQTQIVLDGMPVYNVSHLYGFLSVFNSDVVDNAAIYKNYMPVKHGGRLAAAVQIETDSENKENWNTAFRIGTFNSAVYTAGPLIKEKLDMFFALRGTYAGTYIRPLSSKQFASRDGKEGGEIGYYFYDINFGLNYDVNAKNKITFRYFYSEDRYQFDEFSKFSNPLTQQIDYISNRDKSVKWRNSIASINWKYEWKENWKMNHTLGSSFYILQNSIIFKELNLNSKNEWIEKARITKEKSTINDILWHVNFQRFFPNNLILNFGNKAFFRPILILDRRISRTNRIDEIAGYPKQNTFEFSQYAELDKLFKNKIRINAGIKTTLNKLNEKVFAFAEPRFYVSVPFRNGNIYFGEQVTSQTIHLLVSSTADLLNDLWVPSSQYLKPEIAIQSDIGFNHKVAILDYGVSAYYRNMFRLIEYKSSSPYLNTILPLEEQIAGDVKGKAYGIEAYAKFNYSILSFWVKYNYGRSIRQSPNVNLGNSYPYKYERLHDININTIIKLGKKWSVNLAWVYGSGNNVSLPNSQYPSSYTTYVLENNVNVLPIEYQNQYQVIQYSGKNNFRLPAYHHLDIGFTCKKDRPRIKQEFNFSIINIYNRLNVFSTYVDFKQSSNASIALSYNKLTLMPIMPSISYAIKF